MTPAFWSPTWVAGLSGARTRGNEQQATGCDIGMIQKHNVMRQKFAGGRVWSGLARAYRLKMGTSERATYDSGGRPSLRSHIRAQFRKKYIKQYALVFHRLTSDSHLTGRAESGLPGSFPIRTALVEVNLSIPVHP